MQLRKRLSASPSYPPMFPKFAGSISINPLIADEAGVIALDARIEIEPCDAKGADSSNPRFAVAPYPRWQEKNVELKDGAKLFFPSCPPGR